MSNPSNGDAYGVDYETLDRRYSIAVNLECWELLAMHSIASDEVSQPPLARKNQKPHRITITQPNSQSHGSDCA
jgi:hypothetical protein